MGLSDVYFVRDTAVAASEDGLEDGAKEGEAASVGRAERGRSGRGRGLCRGIGAPG